MGDSEEPWSPRKKLLDEPDYPSEIGASLHSQSVQGQGSNDGVQASGSSAGPAVGNPPGLGIAGFSEPQPVKKKRQSGWTRQRRSRAIQKIKRLEEEEAKGEVAVVHDPENDGF